MSTMVKTNQRFEELNVDQNAYKGQVTTARHYIKIGDLTAGKNADTKWPDTIEVFRFFTKLYRGINRHVSEEMQAAGPLRAEFLEFEIPENTISPLLLNKLGLNTQIDEVSITKVHDLGGEMSKELATYTFKKVNVVSWEPLTDSDRVKIQMRYVSITAKNLGFGQDTMDKGQNETTVTLDTRETA